MNSSGSNGTQSSKVITPAMKRLAAETLRTRAFARVGFGLLAQLYSQVVTIGIQLISIPIILSVWGPERFGAWLTISAVPAYFALADLGFAQVAGNEMTMLAAKRNYRRAQRVYHTAWLFVVLVIVCCLAICAAGVLLLSGSSFPHLSGASPREILLTAPILIAQVLLSIVFGLIGAGFRATGRFWLFIFLISSSRLIEGLAMLAMVCWDGSFAEVAGITFLVRALFLLAGVVVLRRIASWPTIGFRFADRRLLRRMASPSLHYMAYTLGHALNIQGTTLVVSWQLGTGSVAILTTVRTFTRLGITATNMFNHTLEPEYADLAGRNNAARIKQVFGYHMITSVVVGISYFVVLATLGGPIVQIWTNSQILVSTQLCAAFALGVVIEILWTALQTPYVATNRHRIFALFFVASAIVGLITTFATAPMLNVYAPALGGIAGGGFMLAITLIRMRAIGVTQMNRLERL